MNAKLVRSEKAALFIHKLRRLGRRDGSFCDSFDEIMMMNGKRNRGLKSKRTKAAPTKAHITNTDQRKRGSYRRKNS